MIAALHELGLLDGELRERPWEEVAPAVARHKPDSFDYEAEDRLLDGFRAG